jgi:hypothetical protein
MEVLCSRRGKDSKFVQILWTEDLRLETTWDTKASVNHCGFGSTQSIVWTFKVF